jgi:hypothetical protein
MHQAPQSAASSGEGSSVEHGVVDAIRDTVALQLMILAAEGVADHIADHVRVSTVDFLLNAPLRRVIYDYPDRDGPGDIAMTFLPDPLAPNVESTGYYALRQRLMAPLFCERGTPKSGAATARMAMARKLSVSMSVGDLFKRKRGRAGWHVDAGLHGDAEYWTPLQRLRDRPAKPATVITIDTAAGPLSVEIHDEGSIDGFSFRLVLAKITTGDETLFRARSILVRPSRASHEVDLYDACESHSGEMTTLCYAALKSHSDIRDQAPGGAMLFLADWQATSPDIAPPAIHGLLTAIKAKYRSLSHLFADVTPVEFERYIPVGLPVVLGTKFEDAVGVRFADALGAAGLANILPIVPTREQDQLPDIQRAIDIRSGIGGANLIAFDLSRRAAETALALRTRS